MTLVKFQGRLDSLDHREVEESQGHQGREENQANLVHKVQEESQVNQDLQDPEENQVHEVKVVHKDL